MKQQFISIYTGQESFLTDHRIGTEKVLPGVAYLELAAAGATHLRQEQVTRIKDITWPAALQIRDTATKVYTGFEIAGEETGFKVYTLEGATAHVHSQGRLSTAKLTVPANQDLAAIRQQLTAEKDGAACYELFATLGLHYGPGFQGIQTLYYNDTTALSRIALPVEAGYRLPPGILDSALQTCIGIHMAKGTPALSVPYSAGEVTIYQDLPATVWSYVRKRSDNNGSAITRYDIDLLNEQGEVLVRITDFATLPVDLFTKADSRTRLYTYNWEEVLPVSPAKENPDSRHQILLAGGPAGLADQLQAALDIPVTALLADNATEYFIRVWEIVKAELQTKTNTHIIVLGSHADYVEYGLITGLLQTAALEHPGISGKVISVEALSLHAITDLTAILEAELYTTDTQVRYAAGKRSVKRVKAASLTEEGVAVKTGGVYLITGGVGGLGKIFATHLSQTAGTKLVLTGRSELTAAHAAFVASLPDAVYHRCDVGNKAEVAALIAMIKTRYQQLDGIIHSAGVVRDSLMGNKQIDNIREVLSAKIAGTYNLDECTKGEALDFMVYCSSVAAIAGNVGQADYAAGNAYQDHYAAYRQDKQSKGERQGKTLSINWPLWKEGGMQLEAVHENYLAQQWDILPLPSADGLAAFTTLLRSGLSQGIVLYGKSERVSAVLQAVTDTSATKPASPSLQVAAEALLKPAAIRFLQDILSAALKIPLNKLDPDVAFERYGIDSVIITQLTGLLDQSFDRIPRTLFFEYQTLSALADYFVTFHAARLQVLTGLQPADPIQPEVNNQPQPVVVAVPAREETAASSLSEDIAIIGLSGRYPGAKNIAAFWEVLKAGKDCITEIPEERWPIAGFYDAEKGSAGKSYSKWGGFIADVDKFDPLFFNISPREAELMDPQERLFLETVWETIEDAGYTRTGVSGTINGKAVLGDKVGVYVGVMYEEYPLFGIEEKRKGHAVSPSGSPASIANRVSYYFNFHGPSMAVDTMCSSSLTAIHLACESIHNGHCEQAIAGGVNVSIHPNKYLALSQGHFMSAIGRCESFGAGGEGYVPGEGVGAVLLKRLSSAIAAGDHIYGVIKGTAINHGGKTNGYAVPNPKAQAAVIKAAMDRAGVQAADFSYIEAHGTGTSLGDPIEIAGLSQAFATTQLQYCSIGSVKSNIGHCESAAGISGLTKVLLQLKHQQLVPSLHAATLNPNIDFAGSPFKVQQQLEAWTTIDNKPRLAGISSFGAGGSNAHLIVAAYQPATTTVYSSTAPVIMVLSARDTDRLREQVTNLKDYLEQHPESNPYEIAYTLQTGREEMEERVAFIVKTPAFFINQLTDYLAGKKHDYFTGNTETAPAGFLLEGEAGHAYITTAIKCRESASLAQLWVKGVHIDWRLLYGGHLPNRISLPVYPFARERYWIAVAAEPESFAANGHHQLHPLLHYNSSTLRVQEFTSIYTGKELFLSDHQVGTEKILPGAAQVELARAAGSYAAEVPVTRFSAINWLSPVKVNGTPVTVHISLTAAGEDIAYEIYSREATATKIYSRGKMHTTVQEPPAAQHPDSIRQRLPLVKDGPDCYDLFKTVGLNYGTSFRGIETIYYSETAALSRIVLTPAAGYSLIPGVLDSALQTCIGLSLDEKVLGLALPYSVGELIIYQDLPATVWSYVRKSSQEKINSNGTGYDIDLLGEQGEVLVQIKDFVTLPVNRTEQPATPAVTRLYTHRWEENPAASPAVNRTDTSRHILLAGGSAELAGQLQTVLQVPVTALSTTDSTDYFIQVLEMVQTKLKARTKAHFIVVCSNADYVAGGFVSGLLQTAVLEYPGVSGKVIGVAELSLSTLTKILEAELYTTDTQVRYVAGKREVKKAKEIPAAAPAPDDMHIKPDGVYLITGGAGGLGKIFATHLSRTAGTKLILTGRSELTVAQAAFVAALPDASYHRCDVSNKAEVADLISHIKTQYQKLDGIIHSAGVVRDSLIVNKQTATIKEVLSAKIAGTTNLDECTKDEPLDFMVFFSSIASVLGNVGQADYAAANAWQDHYALYRHEKQLSGERQGKTLSMSWPLWKEGGMQLDADSERYLEQQWGLQPLSTAAGLQAFDTLLGGDAGQVMIVYGKPAATASLFEQAVKQTTPVSGEAAQASLKPVAIQYLRTLLSRELKLPAGKLDPKAPLERYGIDSVMITRLTNLLGEVFAGISGTLFFEYQTVEELAGSLVADHPDTLRKLAGETISAGHNIAGDIHQQQGTRFRPLPAKTATDTSAFEPEDIAIIGLSGRYPGAANVTEFWENLKAGKDSITEIPADRWQITGFYDAEKGTAGKSYSKWGGFLQDIDKFDPLFFNISPREAGLMDPQERLFLQTVWETMEDAGYTSEALQGRKDRLPGEPPARVGVYVGVMYEEYQLFGAEERLKGNFITPAGSPASIANRVSYCFNFQGPSIAVDTMCSSSLTAIHLACKDLQTGDTAVAIAGGVNLSVHPNKYLLLSQGKFVSGKGRCESFGAGGEGYVPGEGVGAVLLKKLSQAEADGDRIYGVIKGTAINHGGKTNGYTVPNPQAQAAVIKAAINKAGVATKDISYIEAHGTGTSLGDPIEITGLTKAFATEEKQYCSIGSVKSNIGHGESAAGISGLTKILLQLKHQQLVPSLHAATLNPVIDFANSPFKVQQQLAAWPTADNKPRVAGISAFGAGGSNAHLIVAEYQPRLKPAYTSDDPVIILLSAKNAERLKKQVQQLAGFLETQPHTNLYDIAYTLQIGRQPMDERLAFIVKDKAELAAQLHNYLSGTPGDIFTGNTREEKQDFLPDDNAGQAYIDQALKEKALEQLIRWWVKGTDIDWHLLYEEHTPDRISLPTYPFARKRYWFDHKEQRTDSRPAQPATVSATTAIQLAELIKTAEMFNHPVEIAGMQKKVALTNVLEAVTVTNPLIASETPDPMQNNIQVEQDNRLMEMIASNEVHAQLETLLKNTLYIEEDINGELTFQELGLDSILGVELIKSINEQFGCSFSATTLYDYPTLHLLAGHITAQQSFAPVQEATVQRAPVVATRVVLDSIATAQPVSAPVPDKKPAREATEAKILSQLKKMLGETLYLDEEMDENLSFQELGLDSILGVELIKSINEQFGLQLPATKLYDYPALKELTAYIANQLPAEQVAATLPVFREEPQQPLPPAEPAPIVAVPQVKATREEPVAVATTTEKIAIVGMSGRYPKAGNLRVYWDNIATGTDCVTTIAKDRWDVERYYKADGEKTGDVYSKWLGAVDDIDKFDPLFFNIPPAEAEMMDPQHRIFLEECWKALEDAGYRRSQLDGMKCGTYVGIMGSEYGNLMLKSGIALNQAQSMTGTAHSIFAARMSYLLNLKGPAIAIDTACSSSLVAIHLACQALLQKETDMALAGGVSLYLGVESYQQMCAAGMLSKEGKCKTFDNSADGFVPGEGAGVVVLKRLSDAIRDGDDIKGVILGSGINQDGKTNGITAPSVSAQTALLKDIYTRYAINPETISYVETHGTGTKLGDPVEVEALTNAFNAFTDKSSYCGIGSVKSNLGHTSAAAGVAGLEKILLQFKHKKLAPSIHYREENEHLRLSASPFYVVTALQDWTVAPATRRRAALSSFGFSGTNAHLVLEEYPAVLPAQTAGLPVLIVLSARNTARLKAQAQELKDFLLATPDVMPEAVAYTLQVGREPMEERLALLAKDTAAIIRGLSDYLSEKTADLFVGNTRKEKPAISLTGESGRAYITSAVKNRELGALAELWVKGVNISWELLYGAGKPPKISLPTYSFARERYWVPANPAAVSSAHREPTVADSKASVATLQEPEPLIYKNDEAGEAAFKAICGKGLLQVLLELGVATRQTAGQSLDELRKALDIEDKYARLFTAFILELEALGYVNITAEGLHIPAAVREVAATFRLEVALQELVKDRIAYAPHVNLVKACLTALSGILTGKTRATDVIFPDGSLELVSGIYKGNYLSDYFNELLANIVRDTVADMTKELKPGEKVRILEVGAGTGGTSEVIFKKLIPYKTQVEYVYTDLSKSFLFHAESTYKNLAPYLVTALLNIEQPPHRQGFSVADFDIVIGANVVHATRDITSSLLNIKNLLKKDGILLLNEIASRELFATLTFGLLDGWGLYEDTAIRLAGSPGLSAESWQQVLTTAGYEQTQSFPANNTLSQQIIRSRSNGIIQAVPATAVPVSTPATQVKVAAPAQDNGWLTEQLLNIAADTIKLPKKEFDIDEQFSDYGFDSILGTTLVRNINELLQITLKPTDIFNYPNIRQLAGYIGETFREELFPDTQNKELVDAGIVQPEVVVPTITFTEKPTVAVKETRTTAPAQVNDIAIVGISGQFGSAGDIAAYWEALKEGRSVIEEVPADRWDAREYFSTDRNEPGKTYSKWGGFLRDIDKFDPLFFRISGSEAEVMDPQQRLFLEHCWKAIEDAGISPQQLRSGRCGVYAGASQGDYITNTLDSTEASAMWGNSSAILASRISYLLDLKGPAISIDTACSSSLVAIDLGCASLQRGDTDVILAGGISIMTSSGFYVVASRAEMLSPNGKCYAFDKRADGFVPGEGAGVVILKRLADAERDGDHIYGVIKGSLTNQDGTSNGITAPSVVSQMNLEKEVYAKFNINPETISYVEAHGTGTSLGDPIEFDALTASFSYYTKKKQYCGLGSVKTNIGHTLMAAGVSGVIKVLLALKYKQLPPTLNYEECNPLIDLANSPFKIQDKLEDWVTTDNAPRRAAISSFGYSGTNAHLIIEEYQPSPRQPYVGTAPAIVVLSAKSADRLKAQVLNLKNFLTIHPDLQLYDVAYTLQTGREAMEERLAFIVTDKATLLTKLSDYLAGKPGDWLTGNTRKDKPEFLSKSGAGQAYIQYAITNRESASLAQLWVKGTSIDWHLLYPDNTPQRISLPAYPFARERYWATNKTITTPVSVGYHQLHPLLHRNESDFSKQLYTSTYTGQESFLKDHQVGADKVLPGVAYLEMAREAGARSTRRKITQLKDIIWLAPIRVNGTPETVHIRLQAEADDAAYEVYTQNSGREKIHCQGKISTELQSVPVNVAPATILERLYQVREGAACYAAFKEIGLHYGTSFQGLQMLYYGEQEALSRITLSAQDGYVLNPGILDSALQTCIGLHPGKQTAALSLPFSIGTMTIYQDIPATVWCYVRTNKTATGNNGATCYDIDLLGEQGEVLLAIKDFVILPLDKTVEANKITPGNHTNGKAATELLYVPFWERATATANAWTPAAGEHLIITGDAPDSLVADLKNILTAKYGKATVVKTLTTIPTDITAIYLLQGLSAAAADHSLSNGFERRELSVFNTIKKLLAAGYGDKKISVNVFTCQTQQVLPADTIQAAGSGIIGLTGALAKEQPLWQIRTIDLDTTAITPADLEKAIQAPYDKSDTLISYRNGYFYQRSLYPLTLSATQPEKFRHQGVYVMLGGAGGLGKVTTAYLVEQYQAQVIWLGRRPLDATIMAAQDEIAQLGVRPLYISCDANNEAAMRNAYQEIKQSYPAIHGIFHTAIVLHDMLLKNMQEADFLQSFSPKSLGSHHLIAAFKEEPLDFICFYSSAQSQFNNAGQGNYSAGCTYKDSYAGSLQQQMPAPVSIINWGYWGEAGIVASHEYRDTMASMGIDSISREEGMQVLETVLANKLHQVVTIKFNQV
ncbi:SDR family NAD(P)-dependent oxidoreductase [Chitinophaga nivalis]|uniref:SDR family NAD(P)-dependent oxidoreductase n=1 Tax=Chitinophaga nivalis TaxID=2991709 RepID=A0ABT3IKA9_9BACT|nr:SDR family NAD(P)-dependent oxidoreductase [Chitinophaga nivalis]MCW3465912.1 SDR family NAD(P)-dependent oxidoreductase [Chitinophaga nivalis]MCW3484397.1 SDR family NAD(P)-dependent oxidoreductase [Chitinophaga nivalis]